MALDCFAGSILFTCKLTMAIKFLYRTLGLHLYIGSYVLNC